MVALKIPDPALRSRALVSLAAAHPRFRDRLPLLLSRHPKVAALLAVAATPAALDVVLWEELEKLEAAYRLTTTTGATEAATAGGALAPGGARPGGAANAGGRTPLAYWHRRRRLGQVARWESEAASVPPPWKAFMAMGDADARQRCVGLGIEMLAACARQGTVDPREWMPRLRTEVVYRVVRRRGEADAPKADAALVAQWLEALRQAPPERSGDQIASWLGRRLMAVPFARLPAATRESACRVARSSALDQVVRAKPLEPIDPGQLPLIERLVRQAIESPVVRERTVLT